MKIQTLLFLPLLTLGTTLPAIETVRVHKHDYPVRIEAHSAEWKLVGTEHFRYKVFFSVFTAALYDQADGDGKSLRFTYTRDLKAKDLREQALKTLKDQNEPDTLKAYAELTDKIQAAYVDVQSGDAYTITAIPGKGTWLTLDDQELFFTENADFGFWYLDIWLGDPPISEDLKTALLKGSDS